MINKFNLSLSLGTGIIILGLTSISTLPTLADTFDAADDFSATNNPNQTWQYGYSNTLGGSFNLFPDPTVLSGLDAWLDQGINVANTPSIVHNGTGNPISFWQPGDLFFHPGQSTLSVVRWTAPQNDTYSLASAFSAGDPNANVDVHVLRNGSSIFNELVDNANPASFLDNLTLNTGDTIDFVVGNNGDFSFDNTRLEARITSSDTSVVPEPITILGSVCTSFILLWKRQGKTDH